MRQDDCTREGWEPARRALASRPASLAEGSDQARVRSSRMRPRSPTTICVIASLRCASARRREAVVFFALDVSSQHDGARPAASRRRSSSGWCRACAASTRHIETCLRRAHDRGVGVRRSGVLPGHRLGRHRRVVRVQEDHARSSRSATIRAASTSTSFTRPTARTSGTTAKPRRQRSRARRDRELHRLRRDRLGRAAGAVVRDVDAVRAARGRDRRRGPVRPVDAGVASGTRSAAFFSQQSQVEV